jgi:hypothetical protein
VVAPVVIPLDKGRDLSLQRANWSQII